jgi:hypothetical protein
MQYVEILAAVWTTVEMALDGRDPIRTRQLAVEVGLDFAPYATMREMTHRARNPGGATPR